MSSLISGTGAVGFAGALLKKSDGAGFFSSAACLAVLPLLNIEAVVLLKNPPDVGAGFPVKKFFREAYSTAAGAGLLSGVSLSFGFRLLKIVKSVLVGCIMFWSADSPGLLMRRILIKGVYFLSFISSFVSRNYLAGYISGVGELVAAIDLLFVSVVFDRFSVQRSRGESSFEEVVVVAHLLAYCN